MNPTVSIEHLSAQGISETDLNRFWNKVNKNGPIPPHRPELGPCWKWIAGKLEAGYGEFWFNGRQEKAHRFSWMVNVGPVPTGDNVLHRCDNPSCVNPNHLWTGSSKENTQDMISKNRHLPMIESVRKSNQRRNGELCSKSKLNWNEVKKIREAYTNGRYATKIALDYGVHQNTIYSIINNQTWIESRPR